MNNLVRLGDHAYVTKLAGFEHSKYIQYNATHEINDVPLIIGKNIRDGKVVYKFDWYLPQEISDALPRSVLKKKCIVLPYVGNLGDLAIFKNEFPCHLGSNVAKIELLSNELTLEYLYYYLKSSYGQSQLLKDKQGSVQPNITIDSIRETKVVKFDIPVQKKIAFILSTLDSKIELNNRINAELEAMAKALYDYWFVQFDFPFDFAQGKPDPKGKPYKTSGGKMVWNEELKREIPDGWEVKKMLEVLVIKNGRDHKHLELGSIPVYGSGGIMRYANESIYDSESILIPRKGTLGNLFYINMPFWCVDTIFYTIMKFSHSCKYLFYTIRAFNISSMNTGTAVPSMTTEILNNLALVFPPIETLKAFDLIVSPIFQKKEYNIKENQQLSELRDWLLPMLMNGQVRVGDSAKNKASYKIEEEMRMAAEPGGENLM